MVQLHVGRHFLFLVSAQVDLSPLGPPSQVAVLAEFFESTQIL